MQTENESHGGVIFNQIFIDEGPDVLNHKAQNRHKVVVAVVDQLELNRLNLSLEFHLLLDGL